jgi:hypothetical protein
MSALPQSQAGRTVSIWSRRDSASSNTCSITRALRPTASMNGVRMVTQGFSVRV